MIYFITAYDEASQDNLKVIWPLLPQNNLVFTQEAATRSNILAILQTESAPLFVMSHGGEELFFDNIKAPAVSVDEVTSLSGRSSFVYACFTSNILGRAVANNGGIYWGYTGAVPAPDSSSDVISIFTNLFRYIVDIFPRATSQEQIEDVLESLKTLCEHAHGMLDDIPTASSHSYFSIEALWTRLRVYHYDLGSQPIFHSQGFTDDLFEY